MTNKRKRIKGIEKIFSEIKKDKSLRNDLKIIAKTRKKEAME